MATITTQIQHVYIAGDWHDTDRVQELAERFKTNGVEVVTKWWDKRQTHKANIPLLLEEVSKCDLFVLDMRSKNHATHKFAGSHLGIGMAIALRKRVAVLLHPDGKPGTSLLCSAVTNEDELFENLS